MTLNYSKEQLLRLKKDIEPEAKFWNQNSLFLVFGFSSAILLTTGIELFKIIGKDYSFNLNKLLLTFMSNKPDYYFFGMFVFFIFGLIITLFSARIIDKNSHKFDAILKGINRRLSLQ